MNGVAPTSKSSAAAAASFFRKKRPNYTKMESRISIRPKMVGKWGF